MMNGHHSALDQVTLAGFALIRNARQQRPATFHDKDFPLVKFHGPEGL
jgi:hypothetical protein